MPEFNTLEEARAEIIRLNDIITELANERDTLSQNNTTLSQELESVRKLNQSYFNRLCAQYPQEPGEKENEAFAEPSCEDFAKTLNIL